MMPSIDYASILHFFNFMILGIILKEQYLFAFILGILWEFLEYYVTTDPEYRYYLVYYFSDMQFLWDESIHNKITDIIINMVGYTVGCAISIHYNR